MSEERSNTPKYFKVKDKLSLPDRCDQIRAVLFKLTKTKITKGKLSEFQKQKLMNDDLISTVNFLDQINASIDGKKLDTSVLEKGLYRLLEQSAKDARKMGDEKMLQSIAEQQRKLTMREDVYKTKQRQIAFGRRLLDYIEKFRGLPDTRRDFELSQRNR